MCDTLCVALKKWIHMYNYATWDTFYYWGLTTTRAWMSNYSHWFMWNVIAHPCPNVNGGLGKPPLRFGYGTVITPTLLCVISYWWDDLFWVMWLVLILQPRPASHDLLTKTCVFPWRQSNNDWLLSYLKDIYDASICVKMKTLEWY